MDLDELEQLEKSSGLTRTETKDALAILAEEVEKEIAEPAVPAKPAVKPKPKPKKPQKEAKKLEVSGKKAEG